MLCKALKRCFRTDSVDSFVHRFQQIHPDKPCPSTPTVYRYIDLGLLPLRNYDLPIKLRRRVRSGRQTHERLNKTILGTSIDERLDVVNQRLSVGDWEDDIVKGKQVANKPAIITLIERVTHFEIMVKIPDYHAETCKQTHQGILDSYGSEHFRSIAFDNSSEFSLLNQVKGTQLDFAHPYSPRERDTNENQNGLLREFIPKGKPLHAYD
ncbi:IS30 family transposase [Lactobacillus sp. CRM56-3]|uniref:IS30 family transposase n=1 Tax=Secundilactobacillus folii TaxID=2678357 RepID=A0A7X3C3I4_9LACO|nr:IS30 family transposase [Secundilactobacillus folii]